jgi:hypothetical protein
METTASFYLSFCISCSIVRSSLRRWPRTLGGLADVSTHYHVDEVPLEYSILWYSKSSFIQIVLIVKGTRDMFKFATRDTNANIGAILFWIIVVLLFLREDPFIS